jgi:hypothetical protein
MRKAWNEAGSTTKPHKGLQAKWMIFLLKAFQERSMKKITKC